MSVGRLLEVCIPISRLLSGLRGMWSSMKITTSLSFLSANMLKNIIV